MTLIAEKYLKRISAFPGKCAFRGQADSTWKLHSAATRRLIRYFMNDENITKATHFSQIYLAYHRGELLEPARTNGFGTDDGQEVSDLQLLAKLQHLGAATGLIDFTWDSLVALWFACERDDRDGQVLVLDLSDSLRFQKICSEEARHSAEELLSPSSSLQKQFYCEAMVHDEAPPQALRQRNVFVIGRPQIPNDAISAIVISACDKVHIRRKIEDLLAVGELALFPDIQSFSAANGAQSPLRQIGDPMFCGLQGNQCYQQGDYLSAVSNYTKCIDLAPDVSESYFLRGNAKAELGDFSGAKEDYDQAIVNKDRPFLNWKEQTPTDANQFIHWPLYFNRGNVRAKLNDLKGALEDYKEAVRMSTQTDLKDSSIFFNRGNVNGLLHNFEDADSDYEEAIKLGNTQALFNRGNLYVIIGRFTQALRCYDESIENGGDRPGLLFNRNGVEAILNRIGGSDFEIHSPRYEGFARLMTIEVSLRTAVRNMYTELFNFHGIVGNAGNAGNVSVSGLPGGKGYKGKDGFVVVLKGREY